MKQALLPPVLDETDDAAIAEFRGRYGQLELTPVVVVIAAYEEEAAIGAVLDELPAEACGLATSCIVVVDGDTDRTALVARDHGAYVGTFPTNRVRGAAIRVGYALARGAGARFIVTTDADGQYVGSEIDQLLQPLVAGEADFVVGSPLLGPPARPFWCSCPYGWPARRGATGSGDRAHVSSGVSPPSCRAGGSPTHRPAS